MTHSRRSGIRASLAWINQASSKTREISDGQGFGNFWRLAWFATSSSREGKLPFQAHQSRYVAVNIYPVAIFALHAEQ